MKSILAALAVLFVTAIIASAADKDPIHLEETQGFLKGYQTLVKQYPKAAEMFEIVDAKTRLQLPQCNPEQLPCCIDIPSPGHQCSSWKCCPLLR